MSDLRYPERPVQPPEESPAARGLPPLGVPAWAPLVAVLGVIIAGAVLAAFVGAVFGFAGAATDGDDIDAADIVLNIGLDAMFIAVPVAVVTWLAGRRPDPAAFGVRVPDWRYALRVGVAIYVLVWIVSGLILVAFGEPADQSIVDDLQNEDSVAMLVGLAIMVGIAAPLGEEFFFRGFVFRVLWERSNVSVATIATGLLFGLVHAPDADWVGVAVLATLGVGLCLLFWRTASLLPCIMLHSLHNSISFSVTKGLPWWGFLLLTAACVTTTLAIALLATRIGRRVAAPPVPV